MLIATLTTISAWTTLKCKPCILPVSYDCCAYHKHDGIFGWRCCQFVQREAVIALGVLGGIVFMVKTLFDDKTNV